LLSSLFGVPAMTGPRSSRLSHVYNTEMMLEQM
jgi:hypothetical protein